MINYDELSKLSISELRDLNHMVVETIKFKQKLVGKEKARKLTLGDIVYVNHKKVIGVRFTVKKINVTKAVLINNDTKALYTVPFSMIENS